MTHILRAHQLCMEGFSVLFDNHLSTVWSAPNYCYRCGNSASILEVGPGEGMHFNVFEAAPENERDGPAQQPAQNAAGKVGFPISFSSTSVASQLVELTLFPFTPFSYRNTSYSGCCVMMDFVVSFCISYLFTPFDTHHNKSVLCTSLTTS